MEIPADQKSNSASLPFAMFLWGLSLALMLLLLPFLQYDVQRMSYAPPIYFNEGENAYATSRFLHGGPLYPPLTDRLPVAPENYPPLSFLLVAGITDLTGHLVFVARWLTFMAFLLVAILIFAIIQRLQPNRAAAAIGALLWLTLVARSADPYVGMYDPQMLGQVFSVGALALYVWWRDRLVTWHVWTLACLCCAALFIKPIFVAVPIALAAELLLKDRRQLMHFASALAAIGLSMLMVSWALFENFLPNLLLNHYLLRDTESRSFSHTVTWITFRFCVLVTFIPLFLSKIRRTFALPLLYFLASVTAMAFFGVLDGASENIFFDLFVAISIGWGLLAAQISGPKPVYARWFSGAVLVIGVATFQVLFFAALPRALDYAALSRGARAYQDEVALVRSTPGPALFENPLVGFDSGKEFVFHPFWGTELILTGVLPEHLLTDRIRAKRFSIIAISFDLDGVASRIKTAQVAHPQPTRTVGGWTDNTLLAISENYYLLGHWFSYVYVPKK